MKIVLNDKKLLGSGIGNSLELLYFSLDFVISEKRLVVVCIFLGGNYVLFLELFID